MLLLCPAFLGWAEAANHQQLTQQYGVSSSSSGDAGMGGTGGIRHFQIISKNPNMHLKTRLPRPVTKPSFSPIQYYVTLNFFSLVDFNYLSWLYTEKLQVLSVWWGWCGGGGNGALFIGHLMSFNVGLFPLSRSDIMTIFKSQIQLGAVLAPVLLLIIKLPNSPCSDTN